MSVTGAATRRVVLWAPSIGALRSLTDHTPLDLDVVGPRRHADGTVTIGARLTPEDEIDIRRHGDLRITDIPSRPGRPAPLVQEEGDGAVAFGAHVPGARGHTPWTRR